MSTHRGARIAGPAGMPTGTALPPSPEARGVLVHASTGEPVGRVQDIYVDVQTGEPRYLGVEGAWDASEVMVVPVEEVVQANEGHLVLPYTADELNAAPRHPVSELLTPAHETVLFRHFRRPGYWESAGGGSAEPRVRRLEA
jgi:sporulation protein YlmC with PRC-barrel domain